MYVLISVMWQMIVVHCDTAHVSHLDEIFSYRPCQLIFDFLYFGSTSIYTEWKMHQPISYGCFLVSSENQMLIGYLLWIHGDCSREVSAKYLQIYNICLFLWTTSPIIISNIVLPIILTLLFGKWWCILISIHYSNEGDVIIVWDTDPISIVMCSAERGC